MLTSKFIQKLASTGALCLLATLAACGGGGSSSSSSGGTGSTIASNDPIDPVMPTVLVDGLSFNGVAAVGAPIADGKLTVQCANGASQITTTAIDGSYSITFKNQASLPCFLSVIKTSGTPTSTYGKFSSIATQEGVVNITPLTTIVSFYGNKYREFYFSSGKKLGPSLMDNLTPVGVAQWQAAVKMALSSAYGLDVSVVPDLISTPFTATNGNAIDKLLEDYKTAVAAANAAKKGGAYFGDVAVSNSQARFNAMFNETETAKASGGTFVRKPTGFELESIGGTAECSFAVEIDGQRLAMFTGGGGSYFPALSSGSHTVAVYMGGTVGGRSAPEGTAARKCGARVTFVDREGKVGSVGADTTGTRPVKWVFSVTVA